MNQLAATLARLYDNLDATLAKLSNDFERDWRDVGILEVTRVIERIGAIVGLTNNVGWLGWHASTLRAMSDDLHNFGKAITQMLFAFAEQDPDVARESHRGHATEYLSRALVKMDLLRKRIEQDQRRPW